MTIIPRQDNPHVYDDAFQLIRENNKYANETYVYEYDRYGNITSKKTYAYTTGTLRAVINTVGRQGMVLCLLGLNECFQY